MKIVIIGDGKMGFDLSNRLSQEGHDIVVVDNDSQALELSSNTQDVNCIYGSGLDSDIQVQAGVPSARLVIATTSHDETNILACLIAKKLGAHHTIARVRNPELSRSLNLMREDLGLSLTVNPELAAATEIARILRVPSAARVDFFAKGRVEMVACRIPEGSLLDGMELRHLPEKAHVKMLICAVERNGDVIIPDGSFRLQAGDQISITASPADIIRIFSLLGIYAHRTRGVMIVGGGRISYYLAKMLGDMNITVRIVEKDRELCEKLAEMLPHAMIIHGDGSDQETLQEEGLADTDALIALTGFDEENVVISMYALSCGIPKVITKVNHISFGSVLSKAGIDCVITPHVISANHVLRYVRAMQNSVGSNVEALSRIADQKAEALEFRVRSNFSGKDTALRDLRTKKGLLIACIIRNGQVIFPNGSDSIHVGDSVVVITTGVGLDDLNDILL
ncbi:MAG: Trk system potassium transporter TrkA [Clostridia bacterium]|nr:Trk system potassium transporter TrkA [Clostridia bacterium]